MICSLGSRGNNTLPKPVVFHTAVMWSKPSPLRLPVGSYRAAYLRTLGGTASSDILTRTGAPTDDKSTASIPVPLLSKHAQRPASDLTPKVLLILSETPQPTPEHPPLWQPEDFKPGSLALAKTCW